MKATATAPSNIAFIKYWGKKNELLRLPTNGSISMNLSNLTTTTTVEFSDNYKKDEVLIDEKKDVKKAERVIQHLDRIRQKAGIGVKAKVVSKNSFPMSTGLSSSASGFAALTVAGCVAAGLSLSEKELSILARQASGSACRSIPDGFVEWFEGTDSNSSYGNSIFPSNWWNIVDIVACISHQEKYTPTTKGQTYFKTSPFFKTRLQNINEKIKKIKQFIKEKDFRSFGELVENDALELHATMMTSNPSLIYLYPETLFLMHHIQNWRKEGLDIYFSLNTGHNIHIICQINDREKVKNLIQKVKKGSVITNLPSGGAKLVSKHLF